MKLEDLLDSNLKNKFGGYIYKLVSSNNIRHIDNPKLTTIPCNASYSHMNYILKAGIDICIILKVGIDMHRTVIALTYASYSET